METIREQTVTDEDGIEHSSAEWAWLYAMVATGRGVVEIGYTENGDIGVYWPWYHDGKLSIGGGDTVEDAVASAMRLMPDPASAQYIPAPAPEGAADAEG